MNTSFGKLTDGNLTYAPNALELADRVIINPTAADYLANDYKAVTDSMPTDAPEGKHYEADGWEEADTTITRKWKLVDDVKVPRTFSKLKAVAALMQAGYWERCKQYITDAGLYDLYLAAQDFREDNAYFIQGLAQIKSELGLTDEAVEAILAQCVAEEA